MSEQPADECLPDGAPRSDSSREQRLLGFQSGTRARASPFLESSPIMLYFHTDETKPGWMLPAGIQVREVKYSPYGAIWPDAGMGKLWPEGQMEPVELFNPVCPTESSNDIGKVL